MLKKTAFVLFVLFALRSPANGALYQWVDEKGGTHFSDQPPPVARANSPKALSSTPRARSFAVPQHGDLVLVVPESWGQEVQLAPNNLPLTIVLTPREGDDFKFLLTPMWSPKSEPGYNSPKLTRKFIAENLKTLLPTAVERDVPIREFKGRYGAGYYFLVTDKAPGDSYPYLVRAGLGVGDLWLMVTILSRTKDSESIRQVLQALAGAEQTRG